MRKNLSSLIQKGSLTPKERVLLWAHNAISEEQTGKSILTEAEKHSLRDGWTPKDNNEVREYNRFNEGWRTIGFAELDAQTTYLQAENASLRAHLLTCAYTYALHHPRGADKDREPDYNEPAPNDRLPSKAEALNVILTNSGLAFDYVIYRYAFSLMDEELKQDLIKLHPDVTTERDYLEDEERLAELLKDGKPNKEAKEKIAELMADRAYNKYADSWHFFNYFADIPLMEVMKPWAENNKINFTLSPEEIKEREQKNEEKTKTWRQPAHMQDEPTPEEKPSELFELDKWNEIIKEQASKNKTSARDLVKQIFLAALNDGLLDARAPLFLSDGKARGNDAETKLTHKEIFKRWLKVRDEAKEKINALVEKGELEVREISDEFLGVPRTHRIITGKSLLSSMGELPFIQDYKRQAEELAPLGFVFETINKMTLIKHYAVLLGFRELFKRLSKVYETDLTYKVEAWIKSLKGEFRTLNMGLEFYADNKKLDAWTKLDIQFLIDFPNKCFTFDPDSIKPDTERMKAYFADFKRILGDEF